MAKGRYILVAPISALVCVCVCVSWSSLVVISVFFTWNFLGIGCPTWSPYISGEQNYYPAPTGRKDTSAAAGNRAAEISPSFVALTTGATIVKVWH